MSIYFFKDREFMHLQRNYDIFMWNMILCHIIMMTFKYHPISKIFSGGICFVMISRSFYNMCERNDAESMSICCRDRWYSWANCWNRYHKMTFEILFLRFYKKWRIIWNRTLPFQIKQRLWNILLKTWILLELKFALPRFLYI